MKKQRRMSAAWARADALWACDLKPLEKLVLLAILDTDRKAQGLEMWPSLEMIADRTNLGYSTVRAIVADLERRHVLQRTGYVPAALAGGRPRGHIAKWRYHGERLPTRSDRGFDLDPRSASESDYRQNMAPVKPRQEPANPSTGASAGRDRSQQTARQEPAPGRDRIDRMGSLSLGHRAAAAARPNGGADAPVRSHLSTTVGTRGRCAPGPLNAAGAPPRQNAKGRAT
jgi:hypothetical protein